MSNRRQTKGKSEEYAPTTLNHFSYSIVPNLLREASNTTTKFTRGYHL